MRRAVANPGCVAAVEMEGGAVLGVGPGLKLLGPSAGSIERQGPTAFARSHDRGVDRDEQVPCVAGLEKVVEFDPRGHVFDGDDEGPEVMGLVVGENGFALVQDRRRAVGVEQLGGGGRVSRAGRINLHIPAQPGGRQFAVHLLGVIDHRDLEVVGAGEGRLVGGCDRDVLAEVVRCRGTEAWEPVDEFRQQRAVGVVGDVVVDTRAGSDGLGEGPGRPREEYRQGALERRESVVPGLHGWVVGLLCAIS